MASSKRKEPLPAAAAAAAAASRVLELEEELRNLAEELSQCQADKEFVWSLWKRLQVANPDLTQAVSLVVEREKQKAEVKDRKVLEILQVKDSKIQALEQRASGQQQEINNLVQRKIAVDEENALLKNEFSNLQQKFKDKSQELKDTKECAQKKEEQNRLVIKNLEEENEGLNTRCADLLNDLEKLRKQEAQWRIEKSGIDAKIKNLETDLTEARKQMEDLNTKCSDLSSQVVVKQTELTQKDCDVARVRKELQELQNLYKQNTEHTAQQAELIQQLQSLNMDTQKVLRNQEDAHTAETISYQKLYNELTICFETRKASEIQLQQSHASLQGQLLEKEQKIKWLEEQLQQAREVLHPVHQDSHPKHREQEFQQPSLNELECLIASQKFEIQFLQEKLKTANLNLAEHSFCSTDILESKNVKSGRKHEEPPVKRSRSLSPKSSFRESEELRKLKIAEKKIENLEKTLQLKTQENDELRKAHEKRKERLQMLQTNYRAVKEQLKQWEEGYSNRTGNTKSKHQRADPHQLRQEDSDAVWNELAYFKREHKKLLIEKLNLEEELDQMKVRRSMDKATIQELNLCLQQEREELLFRLGEDDGVKNSTPKKNVKEIPDQTLQKVCQLEKRFRALERESKKLKEVNKQLTKDKNDLKASIKCHKEDADTKERELEKLLKKLREIKKDKADLQLVIDELEREVTSLKRQVAEANRLRNENDDLLCEVQQLKNSLDKAKAVATMATVGATHGQCNCKTAGTKAKLKATKKKSSLGRHQAFLNQSIKVMSNVFENFNKDGWEDMSESSDSEIPTSESVGSIVMKTIQNLDSLTDTNDQQEKYQIQDNQMVHNIAHLEDKSRLYHKKGNTQNKDIEKSHSQRRKISPLITAHPSVINKVNREKRRNIVVQKPGCSVLLRERIKSLQQQIAVLQNAKRTAVSSVKELKEANEKLTSQLHLADQRLQTSRRTIQTLTSNLAELQREREDLQGKLEHLAQATRLKEGLSPVTSNQIEVTPPTSSKNTDLEMKQLYCKLKNANNEITKHSTTIKSLKNEAQEKEERMRELQEKVSRMERDINMKRHLIEDLRSRLKANQETEKTFNETLESFEKKVKTLTEDCSNKKTSIDSLKQRLNVATKEKSQYEQMYRKAKDELGKKDLKLTNLEGKMIEAECAMTELETTASQQLHGLAKQSGQALEVVQKKMLLANDKVEEFITFVKALTRELQRNVQEMRMRIRHAKKIQEEKECNRSLSKESVHRAQSLAASILNISKTDLAEMLDTEDDEETERAKMEVEKDKEWLCYIQKLLEGQFPFASYLMDAVLEKLNEKKKLVEEYSSLMKQTI
ncbi:centlein [Terrapene carolina triunguis]|uniref:centlein n=1 Tax=Terrapene triunguis TaxID=2587831 RepID=UPI000CEF78F4|nr:centlein [Terrapene carolina triunguis]